MTIKTPDSWNDVTIGQFQELSVTKNPIDVAAILCDEDTELLKKLDVNSLARIEQALEWTSVLPNSGDFKQIIEIDGEKYGFVNRLSDLTVGEWVDLELYTQDTIKNLHKIMAILYRPLVVAFTDTQRIVEPYESNKGAVRAELFMDKMNVGDVYGSLVFFSIIVNESIKTMQAYLARKNPMKLRDMLKQSRRENLDYLKNRYLKSGRGTDMFTRSQREILRKWNQSLN